MPSPAAPARRSCRGWRKTLATECRADARRGGRRREPSGRPGRPCRQDCRLRQGPGDLARVASRGARSAWPAGRQGSPRRVRAAGDVRRTAQAMPASAAPSFARERPPQRYPGVRSTANPKPLHGSPVRAGGPRNGKSVAAVSPASSHRQAAPAASSPDARFLWTPQPFRPHGTPVSPATGLMRSLLPMRRQISVSSLSAAAVIGLASSQAAGISSWKPTGDSLTETSGS